MSKIRVLFVSSGNSNNGINPIIKLQANSLRAESVEVLHFLIFGRGLKGYLLNLFKLRKYLLAHNIDLIHAHFGFCGIASYFAKRNQKLVVSLMGDDILGAKARDGSITFRNRLLVKVNRFFSNHFYDFVIFKSPEMLTESNYGGNNFSIIPNGVDLELFNEVDKEIALQKLEWQPGIQHLIFVTNPLRPEKNFQLVDDSINELKRKGYPIKLHIVHNKPSDVLRFFYSAADVLLLASFHEGSPNVIKEAMACNCPIVSTDVGDVKWVMENVEGCFLSTLNKNDFITKIQLALRFSKDRKRTGGVYKINQLGLDAKMVSSQIKKIYQKIVDKKICVELQE